MTVQIYSRELMTKSKPQIPFPPDFRFENHIRAVPQEGKYVYEFIGTDTFGSQWYRRQRFEIDAGREEEPTLYEPIYSTVTDPNLPKHIDIDRMGPAGVFLEEIKEGGEVKFGTITSSQYSIPMRHYAVGLEYSDDLVAFNQTWNVAMYERQVGMSYNALRNHIHLSPILDFSYTSANQTAGVTDAASYPEAYLRTLEAAITAGRVDTTNRRRGPYVLLVAPDDLFLVERALTRVNQQGVTVQSSAIDMVRSVIAYDGWSGTRGKKEVNYPGVTAGIAYLISLQYRNQDFQSFVKQGLEEYGRQEDVSRFLLQIVWDTRFSMFANPERAVEEITWPTSLT